jgi:hypothetical protein
MSVAFWSGVVQVGKPCEVQPPEGYVLNIQQVALVVSGEGAKGGHMMLKAKTQAIDGEELEAVLGTLRPITQDQFSMGKPGNCMRFLNNLIICHRCILSCKD